MNAEKLRCTKLTYWLWQECGKHSMKTIWKLSKLSFHDRTSAAADSLLLFPTPDGQSEFFLYKRICRQQRAVAEERKTENFSDFKSKYYLYYTVFENHRKRSHSTLRAKRAIFTFWVYNCSLQMLKNDQFDEFLKNPKLAVKQCCQTGQF